MSTETLAAGRELDALVAERVMGLVIVDQAWPCGRDPETGAYVACHRKTTEWDWFDTPDIVYQWRGPIVFPVPWYSTDIVAAWQIVKKFTPVGVAVHCCRQAEWGDDKWKCIIARGHGYADGSVTVRADTAPLAICLAALEAVGAQP